jgi:formamidopyrimidine-DNA glycosylase
MSLVCANAAQPAIDRPAAAMINRIALFIWIRPILGIFGAPHKQVFHMPELPEVEVTRRGLEPQLAGRVISGVAVREPRLRWPVPKDVHRLAGRKVRSIQRRGKYLLVDCGDGHLILHLGMSGSLRVLPAGTPAQKHDHFDFSLVTGSCGCAIRAASARCCGPAPTSTRIRCLFTSASSRSRASCIRSACIQLTRPHRTGIKQFLMDGRRIVGVGNIYANESLFLAGIHPRVAAGKLSLERCARLSAAIKQTLRAAIRAGGSSLRDFVGADGNAGYFQQRYWVYDRAGEPCRRCGSIIRKIQQGQRSTFYCPACQK